VRPHSLQRYRREVIDGKETGRQIQFHPGGGHHGPDSYWKVSSGEHGVIRIVD
jgi:hypothetical protein